MSSSNGLEILLKKAKGHEEGYDWLEAARSYAKVLESKPVREAFAAETWQNIGFCYGRASRQARSLEEFRELRQLSAEAYEKAANLFGKEKIADKNLGRSGQCRASAAYIRSWLASSPSEKRKMLDDCVKFGRLSLSEYQKAGDGLNYGKMCDELSMCLLDKLDIASNWREMTEVAKEGSRCADQAVSALSRLGDKNELLRAYFTASLQSWYAANISERKEERDELVRKSLDYSRKALILSEEVANPYYTAMSNWAAALCTLLFTEKVESSLNHAEEMLKQGTIAKDNYLKGTAFYVLAFVTNWMTVREADPDKKKEEHERIIEYSEEASRYLRVVSQDSFIAEAFSYCVESYSSLARDVEASSEDRLTALEKAVDIGRKGLEHAVRSGSANATGVILHALSKALSEYSNRKAEKNEKAKLLEEALAHRKEYNKIAEETYTSNNWVRGVGKTYEGLVKAELGRTEIDDNRKKSFFESAVSDVEDGVSRCRKWILSRPVPTLIAAVAGYEDSFGGILNELYLLTKDEKILGKSIDVYEDAARKFGQVNLSSRVAESYWKMAKNQDRLEKHSKAAESFEKAFAGYKNAAQRITHFADFYLDYASYMKAWAEIERAKLAHEREQHANSMKHYDNAANLLKPSKLWGYLSTNLFAWSLLEHAEELSRKESSTESIETFNIAADHFEEARKVFQNETDKIQMPDEKEKAIELSEASVRRKDYCRARANVEEARIFDQKGNYAESAEKYDSAATAFEKMLEEIDVETEREAMTAIAFMCRAWQKMKIADGRNSPELYQEASEMFLKAKEHSTKNKTSLLASGDSALCRALEFGTRFESSGDKESFSKAKQFLVSASNSYSRAGLEKAALWASATDISLDAYSYVVSAETEVDPERKVKTYLLAEKCLERSAELYERAGHAGRKEGALKTLRMVKEKSEFALSLGELFKPPSDAVNTSVITAPGMIVEEAVGLMKFEHAFVEANVISHKSKVAVGEELEMEIQLANLGKNAGFLISVEGMVPEGFDVTRKPDKCTMNDGVLLFRGRKLDPLETNEVKLSLKPKKKGEYNWTPEIKYMDETGQHKSCQLEQVTLSVEELGIRGWLRGPG